jgi:Cu+-exporting ATPase
MSAFTQEGTAMATVIDPVCKMQVEASQAAAQSTHQGQVYSFCSAECRDLFEANPDNYLADDTEPVDAPVPPQ